MGGRVIECEAKRIRDAALEEGREEAKAQDIVILVNILRKYDASEDAIINEIVDTYKLSRKEAEKYLKSWLGNKHDKIN